MTLSHHATNLLSLISRLLIVLLFIPAGIGKITGFDGTVRYIAAANVPFPEVAAVIGIAVEVGLATLLLVGYQTRWAVLAMAVYVLVLPFIFHAYWNVPPPQRSAQELSFYKDLAIAGGLFAMMAVGPGAWSIDARLGKDEGGPLTG